MTEPWPLRWVISGGQTGVDQAVLRAGKRAGYRTGGMMPKGARTDEGPMPEVREAFGLVESNASAYGPRTWWNVQNSDGTVLFGKLDSPGCKLTLVNCRVLDKPYIENPSAEVLHAWILAHRIKTLNGAGNRERTNPGIGAIVEAIMFAAINRLRPPESV